MKEGLFEKFRTDPRGIAGHQSDHRLTLHL